MCLGYPARVVELDLDAAIAVVDDRGRRRRASTLMADAVAMGDWVLVAAGNVIRRLDADDAAAMATELARAESIAPGRTPTTARPLPRPFQGDPR